LITLSNCFSGRSNFDSAFLLDCTNFFCVFLGYWIGNVVSIPKMCLKLSFFHSQWVLQVIWSLITLSNCFSGSSNFDSAFLLDCTKFFCVFLGYWIRNVVRIPKMCLKLSFAHSKWVLQVILFLTTLSNCVSASSNFDSAFLPDYTKFLVFFPC